MRPGSLFLWYSRDFMFPVVFTLIIDDTIIELDSTGCLVVKGGVISESSVSIRVGRVRVSNSDKLIVR